MIQPAGNAAVPENPLARPGRWWRAPVEHTAAVLLALLLAVGSYWLFTRHNDFPVRYHPDEQGKAQQLLHSPPERNFNHPLLLLDTADRMRQWGHVPQRVRETVIAGRHASALLAAAGVFGVTLAGYAAYGFIGLLILGATLALFPHLLIFAHFFKEDAALAGGIMLTLMGTGLVLAARRPFTQLLAAVALGLGCAAAMSAKYVGAVTLAPCLVVLLIARFTARFALPARIAVFLISALTGVILINQRAFLNWTALRLQPRALDALGREIRHGTTGHYILALGTPNLYCLRIAMQEVMPHVWIMLGLGVVWLIVRRRVRRWGITLAAFLLAYIAVLAYCAIPIPRYALPISVLIYATAASLLAGMLVDLRRVARWAPAAVVAALVLIVSLQGARVLHFNRQFDDDSRQRLRTWIAQLPRGTRVSADSYAAISTENDSGDKWRYPDQPRVSAHITRTFYAAEGGSLDQQLAKNVAYVAVCDATYERFFVPGVRPLAGADSTFYQSRRFYEELFKRGELVWASDPQVPTHAYVDMALRVYKVAQLRPTPVRPSPEPDGAGRRPLPPGRLGAPQSAGHSPARRGSGP